MQDKQAALKDEKETKEETPKTNIKDRFKRLGIGFRRRLLKFSIVSLIGLGINLAFLNLAEFILYKFNSSVIEAPHNLWGIFSFTYIDLMAIAVGIAAATLSNYILNKVWTFGEAKAEKVVTQFLKYAIVGASGAILKYVLTTGFKTLFLMAIPSDRWATVPASAIAFIITVFWNYMWNEVWTFDVVEKVPEEPIVVPPDMDFSDITLITPTFNENENIGPLMEHMNENYNGIKLIVADDGSKDGTREQVREFKETNPDFLLLDREQEEIHGLTISVLDAIKMTETKYYIVMDCDFQHPPEKVGEIAIKLREGFHFIVGERDEIPDWPFMRRVISWGASVIGKFSLWIHRSAKCGDVMSGFFGGETEYSKMVIEKHPKGFRPKGYKVMFELLKHSRKKETKVGRVGYVFNPRVRGESKISRKHIFEFLKSVFP
ncbi:MAG: glycosyltransferase [Candidatus Heimdallarchaeota archaeon]|nr:glycosyltransferase [Candidatus Heimdallarchaeota archaeon]